MVEETFNYKREITHTQYRHGNKKVKRGGLRGRLFNVISDNKFILNKELKATDHYWHANGGGIFFIFIYSWNSNYAET